MYVLCGSLGYGVVVFSVDCGGLCLGVVVVDVGEEDFGVVVGE